MVNHDVTWTTPKALETAARAAHGLIVKKDPRFEPILEIYRQGGYGGQPNDDREAMAQDLLDVAAMAAWARKRGIDQVAMDVRW